MNMRCRFTTVATCAAAAAAVAAPTAGAAPVPAGTVSIKAPKCAKTAKVNVTVYGKPAKGSGVNGLFLLKKYPPGPPSDAYKYQYYAVPASGPLPFVTGKTQSMSAMVPVGVRVYGVAIFGIAGSGATALPEKKAFMVQKCKPRKKPHYTG